MTGRRGELLFTIPYSLFTLNVFALAEEVGADGVGGGKVGVADG